MAATQRITYVGASDEVTILEAGVTVRRGGTVELGSDLAGRLLEQVDVFQPATTATPDPAKE